MRLKVIEGIVCLGIGAIIIFVFNFVLINPFWVDWDYCNKQGANAEHTNFGKTCMARSEHGCSGGGGQCEIQRAEECSNNPDSKQWYCNLDSQRRYYKQGE